jgi:DNA-binding response OmpR family regulator
MEHKILLVEDEPGLRLTLSDRLHKEGYKIDAASDGEAGFKLAASENFDLIILDLMLPKKNGFDICRDLRQLGRVTPILMLTARDQVVDKVVGLKIGADDYVTKPFEMAELLARVEALLRRARFTSSVPSESIFLRLRFSATAKCWRFRPWSFSCSVFSSKIEELPCRAKSFCRKCGGTVPRRLPAPWMFTLPGFGRRSRTIPNNRNGS